MRECVLPGRPAGEGGGQQGRAGRSQLLVSLLPGHSGTLGDSVRGAINNLRLEVPPDGGCPWLSLAVLGWRLPPLWVRGHSCPCTGDSSRGPQPPAQDPRPATAPGTRWGWGSSRPRPAGRAASTGPSSPLQAGPAILVPYGQQPVHGRTVPSSPGSRSLFPRPRPFLCPLCNALPCPSCPSAQHVRIRVCFPRLVSPHDSKRSWAEHLNPAPGNRVGCGWTDGQTDGWAGEWRHVAELERPLGHLGGAGSWIPARSLPRHPPPTLSPACGAMSDPLTPRCRQ